MWSTGPTTNPHITYSTCNTKPLVLLTSSVMVYCFKIPSHKAGVLTSNLSHVKTQHHGLEKKGTRLIKSTSLGKSLRALARLFAKLQIEYAVEHSCYSDAELARYTTKRGTIIVLAIALQNGEIHPNRTMDRTKSNLNLD